MVSISIALDLIWLIVKQFRKAHPWKRATLIYRSGIVPLLIVIVIFVSGYINIHHVVEKDYTVTTSKNISKEGYNIAMIADLHFGTTMNAKNLQTYCDKIANKNPDLVILCGDIVDENTSKEELKEAMKILGAMPSKYGVFYVYGNHDRARYSSHPGFTPDELAKELAENGIHVLQDEKYDINNEFTIIGRKDATMSKNSGRADSKDLVAAVNPDHFILLLDHQPIALDENAALGVDLMLSGHTHGGQIWPVGPLSDLMKVNEMSYGCRQIGQMNAIVTSGIGGWGYPFRITGQSEYVMIKVKPE